MINSAVISGVGGFFGSHLCERLLGTGVKVIGIDVANSVKKKFKNPNFTFVKAGFEDYPHLHEMIANKADVFFHFAWAGGLLQDSFWNYELQLKNAYYGCVAFEEASKIGCKRFVNSGTNNQIATRQFLCSKDYFPRGTDIYAAAKTALELMGMTLATKTNTEFLGAMIPMPYGKGNRSMQLFNIAMKKLLAGESPSLIEGNNLYDMVYVEDIISGFLAIAERGKPGRSYYIGHRILKTFREWIEEIRDIVNPSVELNFGEYKDPLNMDYSNVDLDMLYNDTGFEPNSDFRSTILETAQWVKENL
ncbi:MAG: NAD(P)-dependent oxidoreductase [Bacteroidales bacterium]|nr:NAD(P)-dependent oxidoreductase [Bacteroidales bacterium]